MIVNLKILRDDFLQFLKGIKKEGFLNENHKLVIGCDRTEGYFYILDQVSDSVYGHSYPLMEADASFWRFCDIDKFEEFITNLPPNLNKIEFGTEEKDSPYYFKVGGKKLPPELSPLFTQKEKEGELLAIARLKSIAVEMYDSLNNKNVPSELRRLFYTFGEQKHSFFALDGYKKIGFSIPSKKEEKAEKGAIFNPGFLAFFVVPMTEKSKVNIINTDEVISWTHKTRKGTRTISSLNNKASLDILAKTKSIQANVKGLLKMDLTSDAFGKLLIQHRLKFSRPKSDTSFYLWKLKLDNGKIIDPSSGTSVELSNPEEVEHEDMRFAIPLTQIDWLVQVIQKGVKGNITIRSSLDASSLIAIAFQQDTICYEWLIPNVANPTHGELRKHKDTIRDLRRRMEERKKIEPIKITIERNGESNVFTFFPSNEGILISVDYEGIVMSALPK